MIFLTSFVLVLALAGTNAAFGAFTVEVRVAATNDDAEEHISAGNMESMTSSDLELGHEGVAGATSLQSVGVRFTGVGIPKDVTIRKAWVQFTADDINNERHIPPVSVIIEGELSPNPVEFTSIDRDISSRATTTASEVWDIPMWTAVRSAGPDERTPDISSIIQEIIDQDGWASGNAMVVIFRDNPANPSQGTREAEAFDGESSSAALLHIEYTVKYATEPNPADGGTGGPMPLMQWTKGDTAVYHDVYFGTNPELGPDDYMIRYPWAAYWHTPLFTSGTTYYWRVDEVEADGTTIYTGNVWSFLAAPLIAHSPNPPDGYKKTLPDAVLSWGAGSSAASHDVYFGTNRDDVAAGTGETFKGNQMEDTYDPKGLENGTAYYWRIDEVEADGTTRHTGEVWSCRTFDDPAFIGWWKFDEGQGNIAYDSSGFDNHGILGGNPQWVAGVIDGALELDGDNDYVAIDSIAPMVINNNFSVSAWIKTEQMDQGDVFASNTGTGSHDFEFGVDMGNVWMEDDGPGTNFPPKIANNQWHMITYVRIGLMGYAYVDGVLRGEDLADDDPAADTLWSIGQEWDSSPSDEYEGMVDDARFWIRSLTAEEVAELFKGDVDLAHSPKPAYSSTPDIRDATPLSWSPGELAAQHDVYFGTDELAVRGADASDTTNIYRGRQIGTSYTPSEVEFGGGPYYWRIDEYNTDGTISEGKIWNFTVADYLIVDDFEDYNDYPPDEIWTTWVDGYGVPANGATVGYPDPDWSAGEHYVETTIVHGGVQAMPFFYSNTGTAAYSEGTRTFAVPQNWTQEGVQTLVLYFYGTPGNTGQLYVKVNGSKVVYDGDARDISQLQWNQWNIDFASLGVSPQNVTNISIGIDGSGANGTLYFDSIRLYQSAP
ncbi:MAG: LamG domain-containing protein [Planctomycetes bacterium]|nr:LamG domain-containing protein [Planctomycetota bacterium]